MYGLAQRRSIQPLHVQGLVLKIHSILLTHTYDWISACHLAERTVTVPVSVSHESRVRFRRVVVVNIIGVQLYRDELSVVVEFMVIVTVSSSMPYGTIVVSMTR